MIICSLGENQPSSVLTCSDVQLVSVCFMWPLGVWRASIPQACAPSSRRSDVHLHIFYRFKVVPAPIRDVEPVSWQTRPKDLLESWDGCAWLANNDTHRPAARRRYFKHVNNTQKGLQCLLVLPQFARHMYYRTSYEGHGIAWGAQSFINLPIKMLKYTSAKQTICVGSKKQNTCVPTDRGLADSLLYYSQTDCSNMIMPQHTFDTDWLRLVRMLCLPLTDAFSSSLTGLNIKGGGSRFLSTGRSSPYFLKKSRHSVHSRALSLPAWCQSLDSANTQKYII